MDRHLYDDGQLSVSGEGLGLLTIALVCGLAVGIVVVAQWLARGASVTGEEVAAVDTTGGAGPPPIDARMYRRRRGADSVGTGEGMGVTISDEAERDLRASLAEISRQQGQTAVILERLTNRIDTLDEWRKDQERERREMGRRRFWHAENESDGMRGSIAILVSIVAVLANVLPHIHWG